MYSDCNFPVLTREVESVTLSNRFPLLGSKIPEEVLKDLHNERLKIFTATENAEAEKETRDFLIALDAYIEKLKKVISDYRDFIHPYLVNETYVSNKVFSAGETDKSTFAYVFGVNGIVLSEEGYNLIVKALREIFHNNDNITVNHCSNDEYLPIFVEKVERQLAIGQTVIFYVAYKDESGNLILKPVSSGDLDQTQNVLIFLEESLQYVKPSPLTSDMMYQYIKMMQK